MKTFSIFILLIYWSIIILAPVMSKNIDKNYLGSRPLNFNK